MRKPLVCIDPGHGDQWRDFGAIGADGTREADINLAIGKLLKRYLSKSGVSVIMTREEEISKLPVWDDRSGDLPARVGLANDTQADLFISIHCNSFHYQRSRGTEVYANSANPESMRLAECVHNQLLYLLKKKKAKKNPAIKWSSIIDRGMKKQKFYVITRSRMPAILYETLFMSNPFDLAMLKDVRVQLFFAMVIGGGVLQYLKEKGLMP